MQKIMFAAAVFGAALALGATQARAQAFTAMDTTPMWWGSAGDHADLMLYYDSAAQTPLTIVGYHFQGIDKAAVSQSGGPCGVVTSKGYVIQPGGYWFVRGYRSSGAIVGHVIATDCSNTTANILQFMHAAVEIRDANDSTLQRADAR